MVSQLPSPETLAMNICGSLWQTGFQQGEYSDINVQVRDKCLALHRVVLARSPYLKSLMDVAAPQEPIQIPLNDNAVTDQTVAIVLGYLYSPYAVQLVTPDNVKSVLALSILLMLPDLSTIAYDMCKRSFGVDTIQEWVSWLEQREHDTNMEAPTTALGSTQKEGALALGGLGQYINGSLASAMGIQSTSNGNGDATPSNGDIRVNTESSELGTITSKDVLSRLRQDLKHYLVHSYASDLIREKPHPGPITTHPEFISTFTTLPFDLFKSLLEDARMTTLGTDQARFVFAKQLIAARRKAALGQVVANVNANGTGGDPAALASAKAQVPVESVVLRFGGAAQGSSNVHVTRKGNGTPARSLWKVEKND